MLPVQLDAEFALQHHPWPRPRRLWQFPNNGYVKPKDKSADRVRKPGPRDRERLQESNLANRRHPRPSHHVRIRGSAHAEEAGEQRDPRRAERILHAGENRGLELQITAVKRNKLSQIRDILDHDANYSCQFFTNFRICSQILTIYSSNYKIIQNF